MSCNSSQVSYQFPNTQQLQTILQIANLDRDAKANTTVKLFEGGRLGAMGEHFILIIKFEGDPKEYTFFMKKIPKFEIDGKMVYTRKEERFYKNIVTKFQTVRIKEINDCLPKFYDIKDDQRLVLEDLRNNGFRSIASDKILSKEEVVCALQVIAKFHACSIILEHKEDVKIEKLFSGELEELTYSDKEPYRSIFNCMMRTIPVQVGFFENSVCNVVDEEALRVFLTTLWSRCKEFVKPSDKFHNVICHGDLWQPNLMFKYDDNKAVKCALVDFQMTRCSPPGQDVMVFLYLATDRDFRTKNLSSCLHKYFDMLRDIVCQHGINLDEVLCREEFWASCQHYKPFAMIQALSHAHIMGISQDMYGNYLSGADERRKFLMENRSNEFLNFCSVSEDYKKMQMQRLLDLVEYYQTIC